MDHSVYGLHWGGNLQQMADNAELKGLVNVTGNNVC